MESSAINFGEMGQGIVIFVHDLVKLAEKDQMYVVLPNVSHISGLI